MTGWNKALHLTLAFVGCGGLAYFGIAFLIRGGANGWIQAAGVAFLGAAVLTWNAHRSGEHQAVLRMGAASANLLGLFIALSWIDFGQSPARALASGVLLGIVALNILLLATRPRVGPS